MLEVCQNWLVDKTKSSQKELIFTAMYLTFSVLDFFCLEGIKDEVKPAQRAKGPKADTNKRPPAKSRGPGRPATGVLSNIDHQKKNEYRPNIDHTALYRPNIDRKSSLKSAHLQYLLLSPEIYIFWENEAFREI